MGIIKALKLGFDYLKYDDNGNVEDTQRAVNDVNMEIEEGEFVAVLGHNGSGKSTLAKHLNATFASVRGNSLGWTTWIRQKNRSSGKFVKRRGWFFRTRTIRLSGPLWKRMWDLDLKIWGIPTENIWKRVDESLQKTGMAAYRHHSPNKLSGGQKQRVAIAGVMAMHPRCIVLDEPTAMLDPNGRKEVLEAVRELNKQEKVTVILITHYMEEVIHADKVYVMDGGNVVLEGTPKEIFSQVDTLKKYRLDVPQVTLLAHELRKSGVSIPEGILTKEELVSALCQ